MIVPEKNINLFKAIKNSIIGFNDFKLIGLESDQSLNTLCLQIIDSIRRIHYVEVIGERNFSPNRLNPNSDLFDPIRAAHFYKEVKFDEACWLVFLLTHCGKSKDTGWQLCRDIYGSLGGESIWSWERVSGNTDEFKSWFAIASGEMQRDPTPRKFGNHRKYETLKLGSRRSFDIVVESYVNWIGGTKSHSAKFSEAIYHSGNSPHELFNYLYNSMRSVISFGRTAKFDYLTMLSKINLLNIDPPVLYLSNSTGPIKGAKILFYGSDTYPASAMILEEMLRSFSSILPIENLKMQVLEDALCNWQKSTETYIYFGG